MSSDDNSVRIHDYSCITATESIKNAPRDIRESSFTTKQLVHTLVRTGAFEEIARTILETTIAIQALANEVNETVEDLKERGTVKDITSAVVETTKTTQNKMEIDNTKTQPQ